jgi:hypothetical protein
MPTQLDITLVSYAAGLVSGIYFCLGTAFSTVTKMADLCEMRWDYSLQQAEGLARQSSEHLTGALFLLLSFALQVVAALFDPAISLIPLSERVASLVVFLAALAIFALSACYLQRNLYEHRRPKLIAELQRRVKLSEERTTPKAS